MSQPTSNTTVVTSLGLDTAQFNAAVDAASKAVATFDTKFAATAQRIQTSLDTMAQGFATFASAVSGVRSVLTDTTELFRASRDAAKTYSGAIKALSDTVKATESTFSKTNKAITDLDTKILAASGAFKSMEGVINSIDFLKLNTGIQSLALSLGTIGKTKAFRTLNDLADALGKLAGNNKSTAAVFGTVARGLEKLSTQAQNTNLNPAVQAIQAFVTALNGLQTGPGIQNLQSITVAAQAAATALQAAATAAVSLGNAPRLRGSLVAAQPRVASGTAALAPVSAAASASAPSLRRTVQEIRDTERAVKALSGETRSFSTLFRSAFGELERPVARLRIGLLNLRSLFGFLGGAFIFKNVTDSAAEFETQIARINTILQDDTTVSIRQYAQSLQNLAETTSKNIVDLTSSAYIALSAGIKSDDSSRGVLSVVAEGARLATAGLASAPNATEAIVSILNAYSDSSLSAAKAAQILQQTVVVGRTTVDQLGRSYGRVAAVASQFGVSNLEASAALAEITRVVPRTSEAVTQLRALILGIGRATPATQRKLAELAETLGRPELATLFSARSLQQKGLFGVLKQLNSAVGNSGDIIAKLFPNVRALVGGAVLSARGLRNFQGTLDRFQNEPDPIGRGVRALEPTFAERKGRAQNRIRNTIDRVGEQILPKIAEGFERFAGEIDRNQFVISDAVNNIVDGFLALTKAIVAFSKAFLDNPIVSGLGAVLRVLADAAGKFAAFAGLLGNIAAILVGSKLLTSLAKFSAFLATLSAQARAAAAGAAALTAANRSAAAATAASAAQVAAAARFSNQVTGALLTSKKGTPFQAPFTVATAAQKRAARLQPIQPSSAAVAPIIAGAQQATKAGVIGATAAVGTSIRGFFAWMTGGLVKFFGGLGSFLLKAIGFLNPILLVASLGGLLYGVISDAIDSTEESINKANQARIEKIRVDADKAARDAGFVDFADLERVRTAVRKGDATLVGRRETIRTPNEGNLLVGNENVDALGKAQLRLFEAAAGALGIRKAESEKEFASNPEAFELSDTNTPIGRAYAELRTALQATAGTQGLLAEEVISFDERLAEIINTLSVAVDPVKVQSVGEQLDLSLIKALDTATVSSDARESLLKIFEDAATGLDFDAIPATVSDSLKAAIENGDITGNLPANFLAQVIKDVQDVAAQNRQQLQLPQGSGLDSGRAALLDPNAIVNVATAAEAQIADALSNKVKDLTGRLGDAIRKAKTKGVDLPLDEIVNLGITDALANPTLQPLLDGIFAEANKDEKDNIRLQELIASAQDDINKQAERRDNLVQQFILNTLDELGPARAASIQKALRKNAGLAENQNLNEANPVRLQTALGRVAERPGVVFDSQQQANITIASLKGLAVGVKQLSDAAAIAEAQLPGMTDKLEQGLERARKAYDSLLAGLRTLLENALEDARAKRAEAALKRGAGLRVRETEVSVDQTLRGLERQVQDQILNNAREQITAAERLQELMVKRLQTAQALRGAAVDAADTENRVRNDLQIQLETEQKQLQALKSQRLVQEELAKLTGLRSIEDFAKAADDLERNARQTGNRSTEATTGKTPNALQASELARQSGIYLRAAERARELLAQFGVGAGEALAQSLAKATDELEKQSLDSVKKIQDLSIQVRLQPIIKRQEIENQIRQATSAVSQISLDIGRDLFNVQKELSALQLAQLDRQEEGLRQLLELTGGYNKDIFEAERKVREIDTQNRLAAQEAGLNRRQRDAEVAQQRFDLEQQQAILDAQLSGDANLLKVLTSSDSTLSKIEAALRDLPQRIADVVVPPKRLDKAAEQAQGIIAGLPTTASPIPDMFRTVGGPLQQIDAGIESLPTRIVVSPERLGEAAEQAQSIIVGLPNSSAIPGTDPDKNLGVLRAEREANAAKLKALAEQRKSETDLAKIAAERRALDLQNAKEAAERLRLGVPTLLEAGAGAIRGASFGSTLLNDLATTGVRRALETPEQEAARTAAGDTIGKEIEGAFARAGTRFVLTLSNAFEALTSQLGNLISVPIDALGQAFTSPLDNLFGVLGGSLNAILGFNRPDAANASIPQVLQDGRFGDLPFNEQQRVLDQIKQQEEFRKQQEAGQEDGPQTAAEAGVQAFEQLFEQAVDAIYAVGEVFPRIFERFLNKLISQLPDLIGTLSEVVGEGIGILIAKLPEIILSIVKGLFKGIGGLFSGLFGGIFHDGGRVRPHMRNMGMAGMLAKQGAAGFQMGGYVSGQNNLSQAVASRISQDDVVALLQPGERVVSNGEQGRLGGPGALEALLNNGANPTRNVPVPVPVGGGGSGRIESLSPQAAKQMAQAFREALGSNTTKVRR